MKRRALSSVVSTVILTSIMIIIAIIAMGFANNVFNMESESVEFEQAKSTMVNFAGIVEQVSSKQGSSGYVLFNAKYGGPIFLSNVGTIDVTITGDINLKSGSSNPIYGDFSTLKFKGGYLASVSGTSYLRGVKNVSNIIIENNSYPLGSVFVESADGAWIVLDYARIGIWNLGDFNFSKGIINGTQTFEMVNLIQVQYLNVTRGNFTGGGNIYTVATCKNINVDYIRFSINSPPVNIIVTLTVGGSVITDSYEVPLTSNDIIVMFVRSDVEISMFGG